MRPLTYTSLWLILQVASEVREALAAVECDAWLRSGARLTLRGSG